MPSPSRFFRRRRVRVWAPVVAVAILSVIIALVTSRVLRRLTPGEDGTRAHAGAVDRGELPEWRAVNRHPEDIGAWVTFVDREAFLAHSDSDADDDDGTDADGQQAGPTPPNIIATASVRRALANVRDPRTAAVATFWFEQRVLESKPAPGPIIALADATPPAPMANHLLALLANDREDWSEAARRLDREGLAFPARRRDLRRAIGIWIDNDAWPEVRRRAHDPRYRDVWNASFELDLATHDHQWLTMLRELWPASYVHVEAWPVALALLSAALWFLIAIRLGRAGDDVRGRRLLYASAFVLGVLSIYPTLLFATLEEMFLGLRELGQPAPDAIFFVLGVGLREELSKLLLFLPLLAILRRRGSRIEAMTCGALVGLGFAAEENLSYFHMMSPDTAIARFLTANFLHMALTAVVALSIYDTTRGRATKADRFSSIFPLAVLLHGAYDFFLSGGLSILSMILFAFLARVSLRQLLVASSREEEAGAFRLLILSLTILTGASYIYATTLFGPLVALRIIGLGFIGVAITIFIFARELGVA